MGGAVYIALDGEANFAALPERVEAALRGTLTGSERAAADRAQDRQAAALRRNQRGAPGDPHLHHHARRRPRNRARAPVRARRLEPVADDLGALRQRAEVQSGAPADGQWPRQRGRGGRYARRRARRRSLLRDARSRHRAAAREDRGRRAARGRDRAGARCRRMDRQRRTGRSPRASDASDARAARGWPMRPKATSTPMRASRRASCRKTSRCCRRAPARPTARTPGTSASSR